MEKSPAPKLAPSKLKSPSITIFIWIALVFLVLLLAVHFITDSSVWQFSLWAFLPIAGLFLAILITVYTQQWSINGDSLTIAHVFNRKRFPLQRIMMVYVDRLSHQSRFQAVQAGSLPPGGVNSMPVGDFYPLGHIHHTFERRQEPLHLWIDMHDGEKMRSIPLWRVHEPAFLSGKLEIPLPNLGNRLTTIKELIQKLPESRVQPKLRQAIIE